MPRRRAAETLTDKKNKLMVEKMLTMRLIEDSPWAECWKRTHPDCEATAESARVMAARAIAKYNDRYPARALGQGSLAVSRGQGPATFRNPAPRHASSSVLHPLRSHTWRAGAIYGKADQPVVVSAHAPRIGRVLDAARARGVGLVVIDTAPHASDAALAAARCHTHDRVVAHAHFQQPAPQSRRLVCRFWPIRSGSATMRPGPRRSARGGRAGGGPGGRAPRRRTC